MKDGLARKVIHVGAKYLLPPVLLRNFAAYRTSGFYGPFATWEEARKKSTGYDSVLILNKIKNSLLKVKNGDAPYERDSVLFDRVQYSWPLLTGLLWAASQNSNRLSVVDFGGSLGSSYFQNREFLGHLAYLRWNIIEQPAFVDCGKEYFESSELKFYRTIDECLREVSPDILLMSSVLPYLERPYQTLAKLLAIDFGTIIIDRTPFLNSGDDRIMVQKVPSDIYEASYPAWFFNQDKILRNFSERYELVAEFPSEVDEDLLFASYKGFLFTRKLLC